MRRRWRQVGDNSNDLDANNDDPSGERAPMMQEIDPSLIRAASRGDVAAFEQIVRSCQQQVWRFLSRLLGDGSLAEDVSQETFVRVWHRLDSYSFEAKFSTWVFQIARNAGIDELRRRQRRARAIAVAGPLRHLSGAPQEVRVELSAALDSLPQDLREPLVLIEVLGLRYSEAATILNIPDGTVKSRVFHARQRLHAWSLTGQDVPVSDPADQGGQP